MRPSTWRAGLQPRRLGISVCENQACSIQRLCGWCAGAVRYCQRGTVATRALDQRLARLTDLCCSFSWVEL